MRNWRHEGTSDSIQAAKRQNVAIYLERCCNLWPTLGEVLVQLNTRCAEQTVRRPFIPLTSTLLPQRNSLCIFGGLAAGVEFIRNRAHQICITCGGTIVVRTTALPEGWDSFGWGRLVDWHAHRAIRGIFTCCRASTATAP